MMKLYHVFITNVNWPIISLGLTKPLSGNSLPLTSKSSGIIRQSKIIKCGTLGRTFLML